MGAYLSQPESSKDSEHGGDRNENCTTFGLTSMQGWRQTMEDAHIAIPSVAAIQEVLATDVSLYGVFDGHGGAAVSAWIAKHMIEVMRDTCVAVKEDLEHIYHDKETINEVPKHVVVVCEALQRTFLKLDEDMQTKEHREEIRQLHNEATNDENESDQETKSFLNLLINRPKPTVKLIEQNGEQYFQITPGPEEFRGGQKQDEGGSSVMTERHIEEIVEDERITAPRTRSPAAQVVVAELEKEEVLTSEIIDRAVKVAAQNLGVAEFASSETDSTATHERDDNSTDSLNKADKSSVPPNQPDSEHLDSEHLDSPTAPLEGPAADTQSKSFRDIMMEGCVSFNTGVATHDGVNSPPENDVDRLNLPPGGPENCGAAVVVAAFIEGDPPYLVTANAGDSRCVLCRNGTAIPMSEDHKPFLPTENDRITKAGGQVVHGRVDGNLNLSRTIGDIIYKKNKALKPEEQKITAFPDIRVIPISPDDEFAILACDGIWDCVSNQGACDYVRDNLGSFQEPERLSQICEDMCDRFLAKNPMDSDGGIGCDNMTCIIILLNKKLKNRGSFQESASVNLYESETVFAMNEGAKEKSI